jgi:hypothetical protein
MCVSIFSTMFVLNMFRSGKYLASYIPDASRNVCTLHAKCSLLELDINQNWNVSTNFNKIPQNKIS